MSDPAADSEAIIAATRLWLERAVIGLNLCPFARQPYLRNLVQFRVSSATDSHQLRDELRAALLELNTTDAQVFETALLIHPWVLGDFLDYNDFLGVADDLLVELELDGELQIASFHPRYYFAGSDEDDVSNCSNRSPYPMLHLLRESSIDRAIDSGVDVDAIPPRNIQTLQRLGHAGWQKLWEPAKT